MRVLGIDCGGEYTGYGVVEQDDRGSLHHLCFGAIQLSPREALELRPKADLRRAAPVIAAHSPEQVAIEDVFYAVNAKSALKLGHVRGVAMLVAAQAGLDVVAYAPLSIKSAVVGYGRAEKSQVQVMVARLLLPARSPHSADAADALAIAICHLHGGNIAAAGGRPLIKSLSRMKRLFFVLFLLTSSLLPAQQSATPPALSNAGTSVTYPFSWPQGVPWTKYSITVQSDGKTQFSGTPQADPSDADTDPVEQSFTMWDSTRQKIFDLAQKLNYFQGNFDAHHQAHCPDGGARRWSTNRRRYAARPPSTTRRIPTCRR